MRTGSAVISECGTYRYTLDRSWNSFGEGRVLWIMLNPSTADARLNDPTIRRCINFSERWDFDRLTVVNLFALRSTDPKALLEHLDPVGPLNDHWIERAAEDTKLIVVAWGAHPVAIGRGQQVVDQLHRAGRTPVCLGKTKDGWPRHPLYVRADIVPDIY